MAIIPRPLTNDISKKNFEIRSTRYKLITLLSIELFVITIYFILQIVNLTFNNDIRMNKIDKGILIELFITLASIVHLIAFIIVIKQYFPFAFLIFVWLSLIQLIGGSVLLPLATMALVVSLSLINTVRAEIVVDITFIIVAISIIVLSVLIILCSMNLMKLIKK